MKLDEHDRDKVELFSLKLSNANRDLQLKIEEILQKEAKSELEQQKLLQNKLNEILIRLYTKYKVDPQAFSLNVKTGEFVPRGE